MIQWTDVQTSDRDICFVLKKSNIPPPPPIDMNELNSHKKVGS